MRILITGGTGFLGRHLAVRFTAEGHETAITGRNDRIGAELEKRGVRYLKGEMRDGAAVEAACRDRDAVIHCAGLASPWGPYEKFHEANVVGTRNVVDAARKAGVRRFVHLSTPSLYFDFRDRLQIKESDPVPKPVTFYAATKIQADRIVEESGLPMVSLRPRGIFGPGDQNVLPRLLAAADSGTLPLVRAGRAYVDLTYIDNVVDAVAAALVAPEAALGRHYNLTNGEPLSLREVVDRLMGALGRTVRLRSVPYPVAAIVAWGMETSHRWFKPGVEPRLTRYGVGLMGFSQTLDITEARTRLGYSPRVSLDEGFRRFARWWKTRGVCGPAGELGIDVK